MSGPLLREGRGHPHGRPASWAVVGMMIAAVVAGGIMLVEHVWVGIYICAAVFVACIPVARIVRIMDDTVTYSIHPRHQRRRRRPPPPAEG